ncbi:MAG: oxygen-independent coproporphyrinogen III oxidase [Pseudomonadota bacterium]
MAVFDIGDDLIQKYDSLAPRYTSYPTAPQFHSGFDAEQYKRHAQISNDCLLPKDLSIYVHIPFCHSLCYFCGCNKVVTQVNNKKVADYLDRLLSEIALRGRLFGDDRRVTQIHFGGGTPNFLSNTQLAEILAEIATQFHLDLPNNLEIGIEIDPRAIDGAGIEELAEIGFTRFSIGVQDFSREVQQAINREQSEAATLEAINAAMNVSPSVNVDLVTGLPKQTPDEFAETLDKVIDAGVTRIAAYNFAYMPERIKAQKMIDEKSLPTPMERLEIVKLSRKILANANYQHIGMDHYALPGDSLAQALKNDSLQRNFQGYTTHKDTDLVGLGASAISKFDTAFAQNATRLSEYNEMIDDKVLPVIKGLALTPDDRVRAALIQQLMCRSSIDLSNSVGRYAETNNPDPLSRYFAHELQKLGTFIEDGLLVPKEYGFDVTEKGRYFSRQIAATFDKYLADNTLTEDGRVIRFSRTV